ncbi:MAG: glycosyltransferase [Deltaproteobacteria bacterium]|nr:glycosyltransferase [Deltaproteobacteria bacterium]
MADFLIVGGMQDLKKIAQQMRVDWDRRVMHDHLFWMSGGWQNEEAMWASGVRDFKILSSGLKECGIQTVLEIGCGVGRLLKPALECYEKLIGLDVSVVALEKARALLPVGERLELLCGNGIDLQPVASESVDLVYSFATLTRVPSTVLANYLLEMWRVLKAQGIARLQLHFGKEQNVPENDTLSPRCYQQDCFTEAAGMAGFRVERIEELVLPSEVSVAGLNMQAVIVTLQKEERPPLQLEEITQTLLPARETDQGEEADQAELEYWMMLNHAKALEEEGSAARALATLEYAVSFSKTISTDVRDLMDRLIKEVGKKDSRQEATAQVVDVSVGTGPYWGPNFAVVRERFAETAAQLERPASTGAALEVRQSADGAVIFLDGLCLDHADKPVNAAWVWAERLLREERFSTCKHIVVFGFGAGYHVEALLQQSHLEISVIEPSVAVLRAALEQRDLGNCLRRLKVLSVGSDKVPECFDEDTELALRAQTQSLASDFCRQVRSRCYGVRGLTALHPQIGVLGPIHGGSLPITSYCTRALALLGQRVRMLDVSDFGPGFFAVQKFLNNDILKSNAQGYYVEMLSRLVLDSVTEKPIDILICMAQAPLCAATLTELRKRGIVTVLWFVEDYHRFQTWKVLAPYYDFIFTIQRDECIEAIKKAGCNEVHYLPTACDPYLHQPLHLSVEEQSRWGSEVSFVGAGYHNRQQMFAALANLPFKIWGTEWPECRPFDRLVQEKGRRLTPEEYIKIFNASKINLNLHSSTERDGVEIGGDFVNPRTFELASCGAFQLVDPRTLLPELFETGKDLVTFENTEELKERIRYYREHDQERLQIARHGRETALRRHTYEQRLKEMLSVIYSSRMEHLKRRESESPWARILSRSKRFPELHARCEAAYRRGEEPGLDALVSDIVTGKGSLSETEQKLLFLFHISKQIIRMKREEVVG